VQIAVINVPVRQTLLKRGFLMIAPMARITFVVFALLTAAWPATVHAQDVPGIEICTVEKTMERRTSCLQSNVDFLQKTITKLTTDHQQKIDASNRQIEALKGAVIGLQKLVSDMQAEQKKAAEDAKKAAAPAAKDAAPAAKDGAK
jgi:TolA-binding protein